MDLFKRGSAVRIPLAEEDHRLRVDLQAGALLLRGLLSLEARPCGDGTAWPAEPHEADARLPAVHGPSLEAISEERWELRGARRVPLLHRHRGQGRRLSGRGLGRPGHARPVLSDLEVRSTAPTRWIPTSTACPKRFLT